MQFKRLHQIVATLIVGFSAFGGGAFSDAAIPTANAAGKGAPSGSYESRLPDGTSIKLRFRDRGAVEIAMTEGGQTNSYQGKWILNGEVILVEGGEGMMMQLSWRGDALVTDFGGFTLTFNKT
jgi:hypothetical protein